MIGSWFHDESLTADSSPRNLSYGFTKDFPIHYWTIRGYPSGPEVLAGSERFQQLGEELAVIAIPTV